MAPNARKILEIRFVITPILEVVPEINGHGGKWVRDDEFADLIDDFFSRLVPDVNIHTQHACLNFAGIDRQCRDSADEAAAYLRTAGLRPAPDILLDRTLHPTQTLLGP